MSALVVEPKIHTTLRVCSPKARRIKGGDDRAMTDPTVNSRAMYIGAGNPTRRPNLKITPYLRPDGIRVVKGKN